MKKYWIFLMTVFLCLFFCGCGKKQGRPVCVVTQVDVVYENGKATVTKLQSDAACDLELEMAALSQLIHGFQSYGKQTAQYARGIVLHNDCDDFFRAFPNRPCGLYDLF